MIGTVAKSILSPLFDIIEKVVPDKTLRDKLKFEIATQAHEIDLAQIALNTKEAGHKSVFVSGWRPAIGWICGTALGYNYIIHPLIVWAVAVWAQDVTPPPSLELSELLTLLTGMLGFGSLRTAEKFRGVAGYALKEQE